ncbi:MAG: DEAD/DEAH box helicase [Candidatus Micrarchaeaceae archaeon]
MEDIYSFFLEKVGKFTEVQELSIKEIENNNNCLIVAPTGSGKTEAALLPILNKIYKEKSEAISVIYITPLRALNRDLMKRIEVLCKNFQITVGVRHGDTSKLEREKQAKEPPNVIITTPESMQSMLLSQRLRAALKNLKYVIVDEIHELYYNKRGAQLSVALERYKELSNNFLRIGISATIGNYDEVANFLFVNSKYKIITSDIEKKLSIKVMLPDTPFNRYDEFKSSFNIDDKNMARLETIESIIKNHNATLIFANTRQTVESLGSRLIYLSRLEGFDCVGVHHSSLDKNERIEIENNFKEGKLKSIVATSSLELGIDIGNIDFVIQYGSPRQSTRLLQRIGRSGHRIGLVSNGSIITSGPLEAIESLAIIVNANKKNLEKYNIEKNPLDVLANQISGIVLEYKKIEIKKVFDIIKRSSVFHNMEFIIFKEVLEFLSEIKTISINNESIMIGKRTRKYFIENISVIPDTPRFIVKQISTNRIISTLDEKFVYSNIEENYSFITKGIPWKVVKIEDSTIFVERSEELEAAIPDWIGEDLPVSVEIASETISLFKNINKSNEILEKHCQERVEEFIKKQSNFFIPDINNISIEELEDYSIIYIYLGTLANGFFGRGIGQLLKKEGIDASVKATAYSIIVEYKFSTKKPDLLNIIKKLIMYKNNEDMLTDSDLFRYKFVQISKLFGIVEKKATLTKNVTKKLIDFYKNTVIYKETLRDLQKNYIDYSTIKSFIKKYENKEISINFVRTGSPFSKEILISGLGYSDITSIINPGDEKIDSFLKRIENRDYTFVCSYCGMFFSKNLGNEIKDEKILCIRCKSSMISTGKEKYIEILNKKMLNKKLNKNEMSIYEDLIKEAGLINAYSWRAVISLNTYGLGIATSGRILKMLRTSKEKFVIDILNAQKLFVKNSRFWKK